MFSALDWTKNRFKESFEAFIWKRGLICQKYTSQISKNFEKSTKLSNQI